MREVAPSRRLSDSPDWLVPLGFTADAKSQFHPATDEDCPVPTYTGHRSLKAARPCQHVYPHATRYNLMPFDFTFKLLHGIMPFSNCLGAENEIFRASRPRPGACLSPGYALTRRRQNVAAAYLYSYLCLQSDSGHSFFGQP